MFLVQVQQATRSRTIVLLISLLLSFFHQAAFGKQMASKLKIVIANKKYSSWSLRGWLGVRIVAGKGNFEEIFCKLAPQGDTQAKEESRNRILQFSPTGKVPALIDDNLGVTVVESLAILLHLAHQYPDSGLLPSDPVARALCISAAAEMHAGFIALRQNCPHHALAISSQQGAIAFSKPEVKQDVYRLQALWGGLLDRFGTGQPNSFLFGAVPTVADLMYAPVANRFQTYDPHKTQFTSQVQAYIDTLLNMEAMQEWNEDAKKEGPELDLPQYELYHDR